VARSLLLSRPGARGVPPAGGVPGAPGRGHGSTIATAVLGRSRGGPNGGGARLARALRTRLSRRTRVRSHSGCGPSWAERAVPRAPTSRHPAVGVPSLPGQRPSVAERAVPRAPEAGIPPYGVRLLPGQRPSVAERAVPRAPTGRLPAVRGSLAVRPTVGLGSGPPKGGIPPYRLGALPGRRFPRPCGTARQGSLRSSIRRACSGLRVGIGRPASVSAVPGRGSQPDWARVNQDGPLVWWRDGRPRSVRIRSW
jgi:hypothetical protein